MRPGETQILYGITTRQGTVFIDSFQHTQAMAEKAHADQMGKLWPQCVADDGVACRPFRVTIEAVQ